MGSIVRRTAPPLVAVALCLACSRAVEEGDRGRFPVRLLGLQEPTRPASIVSWNSAGPRALADFLVLEQDQAGQPALIAAEGHAALRTEQEALRIAHGERALVRLLELPADRKFDLLAQVDVGPEGAGAGCERFRMIRLGPLVSGEHVADWLAAGRLRLDSGDGAPLATGLALALERGTPSPAAWIAAPADGGIGRARFRFYTERTAEVWAFLVPAAAGPVRLASLEIVDLPELVTSDRLRRSAEPGPVTIDGLTVRARYLAPGESAAYQVDAPPGTATLSLLLAVDREQAAPPPAAAAPRLRVEVLSREGRALDDYAVEPPPDAEGFMDSERALPAAVAGRGVTLRFTAAGSHALFLGQPQLRGPPPAGPGNHRNLLLVSLDTLRADRLSCYGHGRPTSPFLDGLAAEGVLFEQVVAVAPYTLPAHASLFTGLMPARHGAVRTRDRLDAARVAYLPRLLAQNGFATAAFTGGGFLADEFGFSAGFDRYSAVDPIDPDGDPLAPASAMNLAAAARFIEACSRAGTRWFVFLHSFAVHEYEAPPEDIETFDRSGGSGPPDRTGDELARYVREERWRSAPPDAATLARIEDRYDATIHFADRALASLCARLERQGLLRDAVVVVTSDHGEEFWEHGALKHSVTVYEEMLRVPLIVRSPGGARGLRVAEPISQVDLAPTLLELLGLPELSGIDGHSRAAAVAGVAALAPPTPLYAGIATSLSRRSTLRVGPLKLIANDLAESVDHPAAAPFELYDLSRDPRETRDLFAAGEARCRDLLSRLERYEEILRQSGLGGGEIELSDELIRRLEELGY